MLQTTTNLAKVGSQEAESKVSVRLYSHKELKSFFQDHIVVDRTQFLVIFKIEPPKS